MMFLFKFRYLCDHELSRPSTIYMDPKLKKHLSIAAWRFAKDEHMILQPIPDCIFKKVCEENRRVIDKVTSSFEVLVTKK